MMRVAVSTIVDDFNRENTNMDVGRVELVFLVPIPIRFDCGRNSLRESKAYTHFHDICLAT